MRLQPIIDADPAAAKTYPDIAALMRRVARTLDQRPLPVEVRDGKGGAVSSILGDHQSYEQRILTAVRNFIRAGIPQVVAKTLTGHTTDAAFNRYNIVSEGDLADAAQRMTGRHAVSK